MSPPEFSVIVPVYNSAASIAMLMEETERVFTLLKRTYELILVNDFSSDDSLERMISTRQKNSLPAVIINLNANIGQYGATVTGMHFAAGNYLITLDADFSPPPAEIEKIIQGSLTENTLIYGEICTVKKGFFRAVGSTIFNALVKAALHKSIPQNGSSFRLIEASLAKNVLQQIREPRLLDIKLMNAAPSVRFVPVSIQKTDTSTYSSTALLREGIKLLIGIFREKLKPSAIFSPQDFVAEKI